MTNNWNCRAPNFRQIERTGFWSESPGNLNVNVSKHLRVMDSVIFIDNSFICFEKNNYLRIYLCAKFGLNKLTNSKATGNVSSQPPPYTYVHPNFLGPCGITF